MEARRNGMMNKEQKRQTWAMDSWFGMPCSRETKHCRFWSSRLLAQYIILVILSHPTYTLNILALMSVQIQKAQEPLPLYSSLCVWRNLRACQNLLWVRLGLLQRCCWITSCTMQQRPIFNRHPISQESLNYTTRSISVVWYNCGHHI